MLNRTITALVLAAVGLPAIIYGGVFYYLLMAVIWPAQPREYNRLFRAVQYEPNDIVTVGACS
jgi:CDP-diglyceride synthetase